jgi:hypothetical protein
VNQLASALYNGGFYLGKVIGGCQPIETSNKRGKYNSIQTTGQEYIAGHKRSKHDMKRIQNNTKAATSCKFYASKAKENPLLPPKTEYAR